MDMTVTLGIFTLFFFVTLFIMCFYRSKINVKLFNVVFIVADLLAYSAWTYAAYQEGWLGEGWMTLGNISPLMFTIILLTPFMKEWIRDYAYSALAFLNVGMFLAMLISPEHNYIFNFKTEATFAYTTEAVCHMICSLYGIYLVLSKQVKADFKHWVKSVVFLLSIISVSVTLNFVYHRNYFGMDPYGTAKIYMLDLFGSFNATLAAYYFGVVLVLTVGMQGVAMLDRITMKFFVHETSEDESSLTESSVLTDNTAITEIDPEEPSDLEEIAVSVNLTENICKETQEDSSSSGSEIEETQNDQ